MALSDREESIQKAGKLRVCIWPDYFSISYKNKKTGQLEGIDIGLSQEFAKDLGVSVEYVPTHFGIFMKDIEQDKCDLAMFGVGKTESRAKRIDYSAPYLSSGMYGIANKTNPVVNSWESMDQPGVVVCVQKGTYMEGAMRNSLKNAELMTVVKHSQREVEVRSGRADVFITDYPYGQKMIKVYDWAQLLTPKGETDQFQYAYAVKKGQPEWLSRVNQFVRDIKKDGRLEHYARQNNLLPIALIPGK
ncbi:MAG: ABC transporter substrate-binding protein [Oceanospirillum sp.]|nr:ABC transporter substrate-binding protein [Oceanospirillum sp.]